MPVEKHTRKNIRFILWTSLSRNTSRKAQTRKEIKDEMAQSQGSGPKCRDRSLSSVENRTFQWMTCRPTLQFFFFHFTTNQTPTPFF